MTAICKIEVRIICSRCRTGITVSVSDLNLVPLRAHAAGWTWFRDRFTCPKCPIWLPHDKASEEDLYAEDER